jgi:glyoxylase-like metal-dependent hydrolase (beta-lactamase superfamily II)
MVETSAPGFYRMMLGRFEITALSDGTAGMPVDQLLTNTTPSRVHRALARAFLQSPVETSDNSYLINTGSKLILIDAGAGTLLAPIVGKMTSSLKDAGYRADQVDEVYLTHMHPDHAGGLVADGHIVFPNALVRADRRESETWLDEQRLAAAPAASKVYFQGAMASLNPYVQAGRFQPFDADGELVPGVRSHATHGHTPGHNNYVVDSDGQKLVIWGDLVHVAAVQFGDPSVTILYDSDPAAAARQRRKALAEAARGGYLVAGAHLPFPGLGHVRRQGHGFVWIPVNYALLH